jgi:hypothetical protein
MARRLKKWLWKALEEQLDAAPNAEAAIPPEEWVADFRAWAAGHRHLPQEADDSRESIFAGRGE